MSGGTVFRREKIDLLHREIDADGVTSTDWTVFKTVGGSYEYQEVDLSTGDLGTVARQQVRFEVNRTSTLDPWPADVDRVQWRNVQWVILSVTQDRQRTIVLTCARV